MSSKRSLKGVKAQWMKTVLKKPSTKKKQRVARIKGPVVAGPELKFIDTAKTTVTSATSVALLNGAAQGDDFTQRQGRQIRIKSVQIMGYIEPNGNNASQFARFLLVWDNAPNGVVAGITDILTSADAEAFINLNNQARFTILRDFKQVLGFFSQSATTAVSQAPGCATLDMYVPLDSVVQFLGTGATIASIQSGALYAVCATNAGNTVYTARVRFTDD